MGLNKKQPINKDIIEIGSNIKVVNGIINKRAVADLKGKGLK